MKALLDVVSNATLDAVYDMYQRFDRIEIADGKINAEPVKPWVYSAIVERVKYNADLAAEDFRPGARSQILLTIHGERKDFDVAVGPGEQILLTART